MSNSELTQSLYQHFETGNVPAVLGLFDPAIEWHECQGMPFMKNSDPFIGSNAVLEGVFMQLGVYFDGFKVTVGEILESGNKTVMVGHYEGTNKASGNPFKANVSHTWTWKDGKAVHFIQAADTAAMNR